MKTYLPKYEEDDRDLNDVLESLAKKAKAILCELDDYACLDSQDLDNIKDCTQILLNIKKFTYMLNQH